TPAYSVPQPVTVVPIFQVGMIEAGANHTCLLTHRTGIATSRLHCWGANAEGQAGAEPTDTRASVTPIGSTTGEVGAAPTAEPLALGRAHSCAAFVGGLRLCWGRAAQGQFGMFETTGSVPAGGSEPARSAEL
ncbi:MAG: hypothetical protein AB8I08_28125, partial [Sandaracinaceae bacterium]